MTIPRKIAEKYDIWLLSNYNLIGVSELQISYIEKLMNFIKHDNKLNVNDFDYLTENRKTIYEKLEANVDSFEVKNSYELEQIRIAFTYFVEFLNQENLNNKTA